MLLAAASTIVPAWIGASTAILGVFVGLCVAGWQLSRQRQATLTARTLAFHQELTTGEVGSARDRLSMFMWTVGAARNGLFSCWQPTWPELLGAALLPGQAHDLQTYPAEAIYANSLPLRDLYRIFWSFERIAQARMANLLDNSLATEILGNHAVWWDLFCSKITEQETRYRKTLEDLADAYRTADPKLEEWAQRDFVTPPLT
ncbi:MAG: hypothetical protein M3Y42_18040 [Actinomycetota bacterium]|nr:hypothetical protein [Actinomycetota bacterium]